MVRITNDCYLLAEKPYKLTIIWLNGEVQSGLQHSELGRRKWGVEKKGTLNMWKENQLISYFTLQKWGQQVLEMDIYTKHQVAKLLCFLGAKNSTELL